jgi:hypothetical protein
MDNERFYELVGMSHVGQNHDKVVWGARNRFGLKTIASASAVI